MKTPDIKTAIRLYYAKTELETSDIMGLFGVKESKATNLKKEVREEMAKEGIKSWLPYSINTKIAYKVWNIDIEDMKKRLKELQRLGMEA